MTKKDELTKYFRMSLAAAFILTVAAAGIAGQNKTDVQDARAARMLLGKHMFSLQWISWDYFGTATVANAGGLYTIKAEQKGRGNTDFVRLEGEIRTISAKEFIMNGTIVTQVHHINDGDPCTREGEFTFKITGTRKYWRLQQMDNPCDPVVDYIDVFFK